MGTEKQNEETVACRQRQLLILCVLCSLYRYIVRLTQALQVFLIANLATRIGRCYGKEADKKLVFA